MAAISSRRGSAAAEIELTREDLRAIADGASQIHVEGERYAPQHMAMVGQEAYADARWP